MFYPRVNTNLSPQEGVPQHLLSLPTYPPLFYIGLDRDYTLEEVGRHLSMTRERVMQIEVKAIIGVRGYDKSN